jgi:hypothetical protein
MTKIKIIHLLNRFNPLTIVARHGLCLAMMINLFSMASKLKWGYLTDDQAKAKKFDMGEFAKLKQALTSTEKLFETVGGRKERLNAAIMYHTLYPEKARKINLIMNTITIITISFLFLLLEILSVKYTGFLITIFNNLLLAYCVLLSFAISKIIDHATEFLKKNNFKF